MIKYGVPGPGPAVLWADCAPASPPSNTSITIRLVLITQTAGTRRLSQPAQLGCSKYQILASSCSLMDWWVGGWWWWRWWGYTED